MAHFDQIYFEIRVVHYDDNWMVDTRCKKLSIVCGNNLYNVFEHSGGTESMFLLLCASLALWNDQTLQTTDDNTP